MEKSSNECPKPSSIILTITPQEEKQLKKQQSVEIPPEAAQEQIKKTTSKIQLIAIFLLLLGMALFIIGSALMEHKYQKNSAALYVLATFCLIPVVYFIVKRCKPKKDN